MASRFRNNLIFALRKEPSEVRESLPPNQIEKIGDKLSWFAYEFRRFCSRFFTDPRVITVIFTALAMLLCALLFYPSDTWHVLTTITNWFIENINWEYVRFCVWIVSEITIFGIGMRAFGRFTNTRLLNHYIEQHAAAS